MCRPESTTRTSTSARRHTRSHGLAGRAREGDNSCVIPIPPHGGSKSSSSGGTPPRSKCFRRRACSEAERSGAVSKQQQHSTRTIVFAKTKLATLKAVGSDVAAADPAAAAAGASDAVSLCFSSGYRV